MSEYALQASSDNFELSIKQQSGRGGISGKFNSSSNYFDGKEHAKAEAQNL